MLHKPRIMLALSQVRSLGRGFCQTEDGDNCNLLNPFIVRRYLDGEALGYLVRIKDTPALYPRLELLHFEVQSTEQNSH